MASSTLALALTVVAACGTTPARPVPAALEAKTASDFYPLEPGWKWAYDLQKDGQHMLAVYSVLERTQDTAIVQAGEERLMYAITREGVAQKEGVAVGDFVLKNPIAVGAHWPVFAGTARIVALDQKVTLASGDYERCVVVETLRSDPTRLSRTTFAPGLGPIVIEVQVQSQGRFVTTLRADLRGTTKPGQDPMGDGPAAPASVSANPSAPPAPGRG